MLGALLGIEEMVLFVRVGFIFSVIFVLHFVLMVIYGIIAECSNGLPHPLDTNYLLGRINDKIFMMSMLIAIICLII